MPNLSESRDKHSSLLRKSVNYGGKKFNSAGPRLIDTFSGSKHNGFNPIDKQCFYQIGLALLWLCFSLHAVGILFDTQF